MIEQQEIWKDIVGYEGIYQVSNLGRVKSLERIVIDKKGSKKIVSEAIKSQHDNGNGYMFVGLWKDNKSYNIYVHRLVAIAFIPNPEFKETVNHKDFNRSNNNIDNLEWATYSEQEKHKRINHGNGWTEKSKEKMSNSMSGNINGSKKVTCEGIIFNCLRHCAEYYGVSKYSMSNWLNPNRNSKMPQSFIDFGLAYSIL